MVKGCAIFAKDRQDNLTLASNIGTLAGKVVNALQRQL